MVTRHPCRCVNPSPGVRREVSGTRIQLPKLSTLEPRTAQVLPESARELPERGGWGPEPTSGAGGQIIPFPGGQVLRVGCAPVAPPGDRPHAMSTRLTPAQADSILALQLSVAWAGETAGEPPRLGWWKSDLVDAEGGGDLFARLVPRTAKWASFALVREAARRTEAEARARIGRGDDVWTLFHFGFVVDEQIVDRLTYHRRHRHDAGSALGPALVVGPSWSRSAFEQRLGSLGKPKVEGTTSGRKVRVAAVSPWEAAPLLAAALLPLAADYPLPYIEAGT